MILFAGLTKRSSAYSECCNYKPVNASRMAEHMASSQTATAQSTRRCSCCKSFKQHGFMGCCSSVVMSRPCNPEAAGLSNKATSNLLCKCAHCGDPCRKEQTTTTTWLPSLLRCTLQTLQIDPEFDPVKSFWIQNQCIVLSVIIVLFLFDNSTMGCSKCAV